MKTTLSLFGLLFLGIHISAQTTHTVGPNGTYATSSEAIPFVMDGDTIEIETGEYLGDVGFWTQNNITLRSVGTGYAHLRANGQNAGGKAIWVISGDNVTIEGIEFSECSVPDENGAGIRHEGTNLTIHHCFFHDNENGILTTNNPESNLLIEYSEFARNSHPSGFAHNIYVNRINSYTMQYCYFHGAIEGHNVKTRAKENYILYNRIMDESEGSSSYVVQIANGGKAYVVGNLLQQGENAPNWHLFHYGFENNIGGGWDINTLHFFCNSVVNERGNGVFLVVNEALVPDVKIFSNIFAGAANTTLYEGPTAWITNNSIFDSIEEAGFVDAANFDYHLTENSTAIDAGVLTNSQEVDPLFHYVHPIDGGDRLIVNTVDAGAYEYVGVNRVGEVQPIFENTVSPNPFQIETIITVDLPKSGSVKLVITNAVGRVVYKAMPDSANNGIFTVNASDLPATGSYFYRVYNDDFESVGILIMVE